MNSMHTLILTIKHVMYAEDKHFSFMSKQWPLSVAVNIIYIPIFNAV